MDNQEENRPFYHGPVESLNTLLYECRFVVQVFQRKEIASRDEEEWHVEFKDEFAETAWCLSMGYHHEDDSNTFADGYGRVAIHGLY